ncbi:MAG: PD-(D/E)XK nuclease family protein [Candidatus Aenigmarchaeota archaeon]|nr:PD-(D/E)XK nuclease family protein [Candidatus Aenigmarchaeota archaeon]
MKTLKVNISDFASFMGFCQFGLLNKLHLGLRKQISPSAQKGKLIHRILEEEDRLIQREMATEAQLQDPTFDLDFTREGITVNISRFSNDLRIFYVGRTDKVIRKSGDICIIDDKITTKPLSIIEQSFAKTDRFVPFSDKIIQLAAYCEGFQRNYSHMLKYNRIFLKVVQRDQNGKKINEYVKEYDEGLKDFLLQNLKLFESMYFKEVEPVHHNNPNKCRKCGFFDECSWKIKDTI